MEEKSLLKFTTTGSVDDGKSSLIGRLLLESNCVYEDQMDAVKKIAQRKGKDVDLALLLDGLSAEREQGITIDVAYRYFSTPKRKFIIADTPGHEQYTRNMITGASNSQLAIILIDARKGLLTQSKRHGFLISLLQIPHLIVAVNKMDLVNYDKSKFDDIVEDYEKFSEKLDIPNISYIPVSALKGDNITTNSENMKWYKGSPLLHRLENVSISSNRNLIDFRFPVQYLDRPDLDFRGYSGMIESGSINVGSEVVVLPSKKVTTIKGIYPYRKRETAVEGESVTLTLEDELDVSRGDMIVRVNNLPNVGTKFSAMLCWMYDEPLKNKQYLLKHTTKVVPCNIVDVNFHINPNTLHREGKRYLGTNDIAKVDIQTTLPLFYDTYKSNKATGSFIIIDPDSNLTVACGMINKPISTGKKICSNIHKPEPVISLKEWEDDAEHKPLIIWLEGLSGAGKSTIAAELGKLLFKNGWKFALLDGDDLRSGLCCDLGFSAVDRSENLRRASEVVKLFYNHGHVVLCSFITPLKENREALKKTFKDYCFIEVWVKCNIDVCKERDPKGLYKKSIPNFTGIGGVRDGTKFDVPSSPSIILDTEKSSIVDCVKLLYSKILEYNKED